MAYQQRFESPQFWQGIAFYLLSLEEMRLETSCFELEYARTKGSEAMTGI